MFSAPFLVTLLDRVKAIVRRVARPVAERTRTVAADAASSIPCTLTGPAQDWMSAKLRALSALMRRIEAGEVFEPLAAAPRKPAAAEHDAPSVRPCVPPEKRRPQGFGWMCALGPNVRRDGAAFAEWLSEPAMQAMVFAAPERMARRIAPILAATGEVKPGWFPKPAKRAKKPVPPRQEGLRCGGDAVASLDGADSGLAVSAGIAPLTSPTRDGSVSSSPRDTRDDGFDAAASRGERSPEDIIPGLNLDSKLSPASSRCRPSRKRDGPNLGLARPFRCLFKTKIGFVWCAAKQSGDVRLR
jgi:hypothetical protein